MRTLFLRSSLFAIVTLLVGCGYRVDHGSVPAKLDYLERQFDVKWPTNYYHAYGGSLTGDRGLCDVVVKLEVSAEALEVWRSTATNTLREYGLPATLRDDKLENYFKWWDWRRYSQKQTVWFANDPKHPNGSLHIFLVQTNQGFAMYIHGTLR